MPITREKKPLIIQRNVGGDIKIDCTKLGFGCVLENLRQEGLHYFVSASSKDIKNDPILVDLTDKINALVNEANGQREDKNSKLGIMGTPRGFMLVWKYDSVENLPPASPDQRIFDTGDMESDDLEKLLWPEED